MTDKQTHVCRKSKTYKGFEQGPIRPPSEAQSLLIRVTRNCPWNKCTFCPVYKGERFSIRPVDHVIRDIDAVHAVIREIRAIEQRQYGQVTLTDIQHLRATLKHPDPMAFQAAVNWYRSGMTSIFIQDANSPLIKSADFIAVIRHLSDCFPWVERMTSYGRSHTLSRIADADLVRMREAGLNRIHIGLESGSDAVLKKVRKGCNQEMHILAGQKVKKAGMELSEYVMPGLGGTGLSAIHAIETAETLNAINPDFIRLRTLAIPNKTPLYADYAAGDFKKCTDREMAEEILLFLQHLDGITSRIKSDHVLNLFQEVDGRLPDEKAAMIGIVNRFLDLSPYEQALYQVGRRTGIFNRLTDMQNTERRLYAERTLQRFNITPDNVDAVIDEIMKQFI
ncbi:MAG: coproporphyrinogen III oxidase [Deltaproteobacteria bacterium]|nr:MAG: coproporphyrinogen III oxidase [Deltaproteobacteria bacterium]